MSIFMLLVIAGGLVSAVGGIWLVVVAFREGIGWGLGTLLIPLVGLIFALTHWEEAKTPFLVAVGGGALQGLGMAMVAQGGAM